MKTWDKATAQRYENWHRTATGSFALAMEMRLVQHMMSPWPRRGQRLLDVGCGTGIMLRDMWEGGFDVTGLDSSPAMLDAARLRLGPKAELQLGHADHLPYGDNEFDFVSLMSVLEFVDDPDAAVREAARVARKGLLICFLNRVSFYYLSSGLRAPWVRKESTLRQARWFTPWRMRSLILAQVGNKPLKMRSTLPGPRCSWRQAQPWKWLNGRVYPPVIGAYTAARVDLVGEKVTLPLLLWKTQPGSTT
jgi:ubiquinone/menaquinone biosynthesis C-methylase UbiE